MVKASGPTRTTISSPRQRRIVCGFQNLLTSICVLLAGFLYFANRRVLLIPEEVFVGDVHISGVPATSDNNKVQSSAAAVTTKLPSHQVAGLSCKKWGGPPDYVAEEMVYWNDIPQDALFESPFKKVGPPVKYFTFEPDEGGWNNIRMAMETAVTLALAMGRILVLPPEQKMYLLHKGDKGQKNRFTFKDFYHFDSVEAEHPHLTVISFEEFLKREAISGNMRDTKTGKVSFPPDNITNWDGKYHNFEAGKKGIFPWLRSVTKTLDWDMDDCLASFPKEPGPAGVASLESAFKEVEQKIAGLSKQARINSYNNNPVPVDASPQARIREMLATRKKLCIYGEDFQQAKVVHAMGDNASGARMLAHFYAFLFFEDWKHALWTKRFVRDHLRYVDEIQCAAARFVDFLHNKARQFGDPDGNFYTLHIRRGDFQYKETRIDAKQIFESIRDVIPVNSTLYIGKFARLLIKCLPTEILTYCLTRLDLQPRTKKRQNSSKSFRKTIVSIFWTVTPALLKVSTLTSMAC
jgi:GDP-fucose protein O-fucosyltransferase